MRDRRRAERFMIMPVANATIQVSSTERRERGAVIRDLSETGLLFVSRSRFDIGERLVVKFPQDGGSGTGRVVRESLDDHEDTLFHHLIAIEFDAQPSAQLAAG
jgi:hypothetical protein